MTSKALWGGVVALVVAFVIGGGVWLGGAIADQRAARAEAAAGQPVPAKPPKPGAPVATPNMVQVPGQAAPRPGIAGVVLDVTGNEITVKSRQGPTGRIVVGPNTIVRRRGQRISLGDLKPRDQVIAVGRPNAQQRTLQATLVVVDPPTLPRPRAARG
jgi:hypothetical protein